MTRFDPTQFPGDLGKIRHILNLARAEINRQDPDLALQLLTRVRVDVEKHEGTWVWVEHRLLIAQALSAKGNDGAEQFFERVLEEIPKLEGTQAETELVANEHFGDFLVRHARKPSKARDYYSRALEIALALGLREDAARIRLRLTRINLEVDKDLLLADFKVLKRVGKQQHYTCQEQLAAWELHTGECEEAGERLRFARESDSAKEKYFAHLLGVVRAKTE